MTITTARRVNKTRGNWTCAVALPALLLATHASGAKAAHLTGPTYTIPPPGYSFVFSGNSGRSGGGDVTLSGFDLSKFAELYWGPAPVSVTHAVSASMDGAINSPGEDLAFNLADSSLAGGIARWTGSTSLTHSLFPPGNYITVTVPLRFTLTVTDAGGAVSLIEASAGMGIPAVWGWCGGLRPRRLQGESAHRGQHGRWFDLDPDGRPV